MGCGASASPDKGSEPVVVEKAATKSDAEAAAVIQMILEKKVSSPSEEEGGTKPELMATPPIKSDAAAATVIQTLWNKKISAPSEEDGGTKLEIPIPPGKETIVENLMKRSGAPKEEVVQALSKTNWHGGQALTELEKQEKARPWHTALANKTVGAEVLDAVKPPSYWENQDLSNNFDVRCAALQEFAARIQEMLNGTFIGKRTRDRHGQMPKELQLVSCERIEDADMWRRYSLAKHHILEKRKAGVQPICELDGDPESGHVRTHQFLSESFAQRLDDQVNECYLWHGTSEEGAKGISEHGFKIDMAGHSAGTMFGPGCYLAECSSKSDEYAKEMQNGHYALVLCRVICGEMYRTTEPKMWSIREALQSGAYDTVLGDREAERGTYREFVVYDQDMIYPEYVVEYKRVFE